MLVAQTQFEIGERIKPHQEEDCIPIDCDDDIVDARSRVRELGERMGFSSTDLLLLTTAISELARNIILYAKTGEILVRRAKDPGREGIVIEARDQGPGIANVARALDIGYSTSGNLGLGLPGTRRLMDKLDVVSLPGRGTTITATKWRR